jgi:hypothetical protein
MFENSRRTSSVAAFAFAAFALAGTLEAQATRTWVSGVGDDANPCSRTAPCKTFAGAISKTAARGEINVLDPGGYGAVTITKSITIDGGGFIASVLVSGTNGIIVSAAATDTIFLRNIQLTGIDTGLNGIRVLSAAAIHLENVTIDRFTGFGVAIESSSNIQVTIRESTIEGNGTATTGGGVLLQPGAAANAALTMEETLLTRNRTGLLVSDRGKATLADTVATSNTSFGFHARSTAAACEINLQRSTASHNGGAAIRSEGAAATVRLSETGIFANATGLASVGGGQLVSFGNNRNGGNTVAGAPTSTVAQQ